MKILKFIFLRDWKYKTVAILISIALWGVVNFGKRTPVTISKYVEITNRNEDLHYTVEPERVNITIYVVERLITSKFAEKIRSYVDVKNVSRPGSYKLQVKTTSELPFFIQPSAVDPPDIRLIVKKRPP